MAVDVVEEVYDMLNVLISKVKPQNKFPKSNKFTKKAENVLKKAVTFSGELGHTYIGSEHILMGLAAEHDSVSSKILTSHGIHLDDIRQSIIEISGRGVPGNVD